LVETKDSLTSFAFDPAGGAAVGVDAIFLEVQIYGGERLNFYLADSLFPNHGAREAFAVVAQDCRHAGWDYANDHERHFAWSLMRGKNGAVSLVFGKPGTDWLSSVIECDANAKAMVFKSTLLPPGSITGRTLPLTLRLNGREFSAHGRIEMPEDSDDGFHVARFSRARPLLDQLRAADDLVIQAGMRRATLPARGLAALLARFEAACGL
jgi:hypothetical protein